MLHAFNHKNVQRLLLSKHKEHKNEKSEDGVTSMVFSSLAFMTARQAHEAMIAILGDYVPELRSIEPCIGHEIILWPQGLKAKGWKTAKMTRCEPDLLARFEFADGKRLNIIGEMKWDWRMPKEELAAEVRREVEAVRQEFEGEIHPVIFTKDRTTEDIDGTPVLTWSEVGRRLATHGRIASDGSALWASEAAMFLEKANVRFFDGFPSTSREDWRADKVWEYVS